jgi:hypothetical protein
LDIKALHRTAYSGDQKLLLEGKFIAWFKRALAEVHDIDVQVHVATNSPVPEIRGRKAYAVPHILSDFMCCCLFYKFTYLLTYSVALVRKRTIPTKRLF